MNLSKAYDLQCEISIQVENVFEIEFFISSMPFSKYLC